MRNVSSQGSQRPKRRNYLPSLVSFLTPKVLGFLGAVLGTACTLTFASKPQLTAKPIANAQIEVKSSVVQPTASPTARNFLTLGDRSIKKEATIFPRLRSFIDSSQASKSLPLTLKSLQRQQLQHLDSSRDAELKLPIHLKRSPQPSAQNRPTDAVDRVDALAQLPKERSPVVETQPSQERSTQPRVETQSLQERSTEPVVETQSSQKRSQPVPTQRDVALTLSDVVILALENNRPLKNAYLERIAQRQDLAVAEDKFVPNFTPDVSISIARFRSDGTITTTDIGIGATVSVTIPTGGELRFRWDTTSQTSDFDDFGIDAIAIDNDTFGQNLQLSFQQPLLRGAGININRASINIARLTEQGNILALKSTLIETITEAIFAYRDLLRSQERL